MRVLYGWSALAWWSTPPQLRDVELSAEALAWYAPGEQWHELDALDARLNARTAARAVARRSLLDLKGVPFPVELLCERSERHERNPFFTIRRTDRMPPHEHLHDIGNGLFVASPELALVQIASSCEMAELVLMMFELAGSYADVEPTARLRATIGWAQSEAAFLVAPRGLRASVAHCDQQGRAVADSARAIEEDAWAPCIDRMGNITTLWRRAPLVTMETLREAAQELVGLRGGRTFARAVPFVIEGSGSPLESKLALFECLPPRYGGEGWPAPLLNCRIDYTPEAQRLAGSRYAVCDQLWREQRAVVEVNGMAFHADRMGFKVESNRTAALEAMGLRVVEVSYAQLSNLDRMRLRMATLAEQLGLKSHQGSPCFDRNQAHLYDMLFSRPGRSLKACEPVPERDSR